MKRILIMTVLLVIALLAITIPVAASSWDIKVTGGGLASSGGIDFSITVSAKQDIDGEVSGQMQYSRSEHSVADLSMHGTVECIGVFLDGTVAVAAGPAKAQNDPSGAVHPDAWMVVEIREGGAGSGDRVSVRLMDEAAGRETCLDPSSSFPGLIYDGNFNIRSTGSDLGFGQSEMTALNEDETRYAVITSPLEDAEVSGWVEFAAVLHNDEVDDGLDWAVRFEDCNSAVATVFGNVDGHTDPSSWDGESFSTGADTSDWEDWEPGTYCFVFDPLEKTGEEDVRETSTFTIREPEEGDFCEILWKPPIRLGNYVMKVGANLPIKFFLADCDGKKIHGEAEPELVVNYYGNGENGENGENGDEPVNTFPLDLKRGTGGYQFLALFHTKTPGRYEAVVTYQGGIWVQPFEVVDPRADKGNLDSEEKLTGQDRDKPGKPESQPKDPKPKGKPGGEPPGKGKKPDKH